MLQLPDQLTTGPALVHCDALRASRLAERSTSRATTLAAHAANVLQLAEGRDLWVPTFNYDFCRTGTYDVDADASQVGPITEHLRVTHCERRTRTPVFNVGSVGAGPPEPERLPETVDPFAGGSVFDALVQQSGCVVWYGAPLSSSTIIHHAERVSGGPVYRYDKVFHGRVVSGASEQTTALLYHVRPLGQHVDYDWTRLEETLTREGVLTTLGGGTVRCASAASLTEVLTQMLADDPLSLLDAQSRAWVEPELHRLGRRFELGDFEQPAT